MTRWRRSPRTLGTAVERMRDDLAPQTALAEVQRIWAQTVGEVIAGEAQPTAERYGVLTVSCSASVWAHELDLMAPAILERLNRGLASAHVDRLRCVTLPSQ